MKISTLFPSKYLKAEDLGGKEYTLTIARFAIEEMGVPPQKEEKPVLYFKEAKKGLVCNRTNAMTIAAMYTPETDNWIGKRITLYSTKVKAFGAIHDAVRIRPDVPPPPRGDNGDGDGPLEQGIDDLEDVVDDVDMDNTPQAPAPAPQVEDLGDEPLDYSDPGNPFHDEPTPPIPATGNATPHQVSRIKALSKELFRTEWVDRCGDMIAAANKARARNGDEERAASLEDLTATEAKFWVDTLLDRRAKAAIDVQSNGAQKAPRVAA